MDVRLLDAEPTAVERDAVDAFLGPSLAIWTGTDAIDNGHAAHGGHAVRSQRHLVLPTLHALHERAGWISPGGLNYVARRLTVPEKTRPGYSFTLMAAGSPTCTRTAALCGRLA